jgi:hypothetical protein
MKPLVAAAPDARELEIKVRDARARIAFYASTPAYVAAFDHLGLGDLARAAQQLSRAQRWEELPPLIDDAVLDRFVVIGTYDVVAQRLIERYGRIVTHVEFSIPVRNDWERETLARMVREVRATGTKEAERTIRGNTP